MANLDFKTDLILGNQGESTIINFLESKGCTFINSNHDNKYDIKMNRKGVETTYEIKTDVLITPTRDTGNMFVEFQCRAKPSGIATSEAEWFVTYFKNINEAWFIKSEKLRRLINENKFHIIKNGGDIGSATHGYLIRREKFKEHFHVCKI
jgi:hypothetical protein